MAVHVLQRQEHAVGLGVDGDAMSVRVESPASERAQPAVLELEHGDVSGLCGHIEALQAGVVGKHVGHTADRLVVDRVAGSQIDGDQGGVALTRDERERTVPGDGVKLDQRLGPAEATNTWPVVGSSMLLPASSPTATVRTTSPVSAAITVTDPSSLFDTTTSPEAW